MKRLPNWRTRLFDLIAEKRDQDFKYGKNDCTLFGADVVLALTGDDLAENFRGKYRSLSGGIKLLKKAGYSSHIDFVEKSFEEKPTAFANVGDLAFVDTGNGTAICVVMGSFAQGISEDGGLVQFPVSNLIKSFKV